MLDEYRECIKRKHQVPLFIPRRFMGREEWDRMSGEDIYRTQGVFRELQPDLAKVLEHERVIIVGEPGSGKTTVAHAAMLEFLDRGVIPFFAELSGYRGHLALLLDSNGHYVQIRELILQETSPPAIAFVLDGLDEVPPEHLDNFIAQLERLVDSEPQGRLFLTCRQAYYESVRSRLTVSLTEFYPLSFGSDDIRAVAEHYGVNGEAFTNELARVGLEVEASNPFILNVLIEAFRRGNRLHPLRSGNMGAVLDALINSRPRFAARRQRRALRMLAVAMEVYGRNELTQEEAVRILVESMDTDEREAQELLDEMACSILLRSASRFRFQMRSYGEFLAAQEMQNESLERVLDLVCFQGTRVPAETWRNTVSYLVECHGEARKCFSYNHPDWVLGASPSAFSPAEATELVQRILARLEQKDEFLIGHPVVNHHRLAQFCGPEVLPLLKEKLQSSRPSVAANAMLLLGHMKTREVVPRALALATERTNSLNLRRSALFSIALAGDASVMPKLTEAYDSNDPLSGLWLDCIGALTTPQTIRTVLPLLGRTDVLLSAAYERFRSFRSREALEAVLDYFLENPNAARNPYLCMYVEPIWSLLNEFWDERTESKLTALLVKWEFSKMDGGLIDPLPAIVKSIIKNDPRGSVSRRFLGELLSCVQPLRFLCDAIAAIVTPATAEWLLSLGESAREITRRLAFTAENPEVRRVLQAMPEELSEARKAYRPELQAEQTRAEAQKRPSLVADQKVITESSDFPELLRAFHSLPREHWPNLDTDRRDWLSRQIGGWLRKMDLANTIVWLNESQFRRPGDLHLVLSVLDHYALRVTEDEFLVLALLGMDHYPVANYYRRHGFSEQGRKTFDRLFCPDSLPVGAVSAFLNFLESTDYDSDAVREALFQFAKTSPKGSYSAAEAVRLLAKRGTSNEVLLEVSQRSADVQAKEQALDILIDRQHIPTIRRRLAALLEDDQELKQAERPFAEQTPVTWISKIRSPKAWTLLVKVRRRALELALPNIVGLIEATMATIDKAELITVVKEQLEVTPPGWKETLAARILRYEQELRYEKAQATPFETVLTKLTTKTSMKRVKVYCEGPSDLPLFQWLRDQFRRLGIGELSAQSIGGWNNVLHPNYDFEPLWDGCCDVVMIMDGDKGRRLSDPDRPLSPKGDRLQSRLEAVGIKLHVLRRYGIENYFTQRAMEDVLRRNLSEHFPLDETRPVGEQIPGGWDKNRNAAVFEHMSLQDVKETDLAEICEDIARRMGYKGPLFN
jgi:hypothetical protein